MKKTKGEHTEYTGRRPEDFTDDRSYRMYKRWKGGRPGGLADDRSYRMYKRWKGDR